MKKSFLIIALLVQTVLQAHSKNLNLITINNTDKACTLYQKQGQQALILKNVEINEFGVDQNSIADIQTELFYNFFAVQKGTRPGGYSIQGVEKTINPIFFSIESLPPQKARTGLIRLTRINENNEPVIMINNTTTNELLLELEIPKMNVIKSNPYEEYSKNTQGTVLFFQKIPAQQVTIITRPDLSVTMTQLQYRGQKQSFTPKGLQTLKATLTLLPKSKTSSKENQSWQQPERFIDRLDREPNEGSSSNITVSSLNTNQATFILKSNEPHSIFTIKYQGNGYYLNKHNLLVTDTIETK